MKNSFGAYEVAREWLRGSDRTVLVVTSTERSAETFKDDLEFFTTSRTKGEVCLFPAPDTIPYLRLTPQRDIWIDRLKILYKLKKNEPLAVVAPIEAVSRLTPPEWIFNKYSRTIRQTETIDLDEFSRWLVEAGYTNQPLVEEEGAFSIRGGIIDIFPPTTDRPVRIELDGNDITTIRTFDPSTQRSSFSINQFTLIPVRNVIINTDSKELAFKRLKELCDANDIKTTERREFAEKIEHNFYTIETETLAPLFYERLSSIYNYLPKESSIYLENGIEVEAEHNKLLRKIETAYNAVNHIEKIVRPESLYLKGFKSEQFVTKDLSDKKPTLFDFAPVKQEAVNPHNLCIGVGVKSAIANIKKWQEAGLRIIISCHTTIQAERMLDILRWHSVGAEINEEPFGNVLARPRSTVHIMLGRLSGGFVNHEEGFVLLADQDIFGSKIVKKPPMQEAFQSFSDFSELSEGDPIIHREHGIGRYLGLKNLDIGGTKNDFIILEYLAGDKLYLPVWKINFISRYIGTGTTTGNLSLDKLGGTRWSKTQAKATAAIRTMAMELLKIYAARKINNAFAFGARDETFEEFEAAFPYDETPDQWRAIEETLTDMQSEKATDRLICGDVGYGKTEVAMRAAFRAVLDGKQVAILVPTTVLAFQHYENFTTRFANWPVKIEMLSRFRSRTEQKKIVEQLSRGEVNVVIGTHRLLQKDIRFADLGLLIIDEEHRFGVAHKERIRKLKAVVDTITMSATPIPRTLHLSLAGIRDVSIINTPPANRLSIRTYIAEFDEALIRGAIMAELSRGGQIFFVHNRVETINKLHEMLAKVVPEAKIVVGHGQMNEHELEDVMIRFLERHADILLCTTIIESGLDIPNANTIIINRADMFGLAQLYQLRGRVGRSNAQAYAYLLTPNPPPFNKGGGITPIAQKRLSLLQKYTDLGSGFQIAMHDLEIRGAGNILGVQQSGHIDSIGYDMYIELLEKTINRLQGKVENPKIDTEILFPLPAYIPEDYIANEGQRLVLYRRLAAIENVEGLEKFEEELVDRFGPTPEFVKNLLSVVELKIIAKDVLINSVQYDGNSLIFKFNSQTLIKPQTILELIKKEPKRFAFKPPETLYVLSKGLSGKEALSHAKSIIENYLK